MGRRHQKEATEKYWTELGNGIAVKFAKNCSMGRRLQMVNENTGRRDHRVNIFCKQCPSGVAGTKVVPIDIKLIRLIDPCPTCQSQKAKKKKK